MKKIANPIGTSVQSNNTTAALFVIEFESYPLSVVFPTEPPKNSLKYVSGKEDPSALKLIINTLKKDSLYKLSEEEKNAVWNYRNLIANKVQLSKGLPKLLSSVPYNNKSAVNEMHKLLANWEDLGPIKSLELLDARYADAVVRE